MDGSEPVPSKAELSKTPSWIMLGFVLGALAVWGFRREQSSQVAPAPPPPAAVVPVQPSEPARNVTAVEDLPSLAAIEAVFSRWGDYALWEDDRTEVALWNSVTNDFTDFFEVWRTTTGYYFRSLPRLSRPWTDAKPPRESPLRFTEPVAQRRARLEGRLSPQRPETAARTGPWKMTPEVGASRTEVAPITPPAVPPPEL